MQDVATKEIVEKFSQLPKEMYKFFFIDACHSAVSDEPTPDHAYSWVLWDMFSMFAAAAAMPQTFFQIYDPITPHISPNVRRSILIKKSTNIGYNVEEQSQSEEEHWTAVLTSLRYYYFYVVLLSGCVKIQQIYTDNIDTHFEQLDRVELCYHVCI